MCHVLVQTAYGGTGYDCKRRNAASKICCAVGAVAGSFRRCENDLHRVEVHVKA